MVPRKLWPDAGERILLGRFYLADGISEALNVIFPFQFIYLYLVMERPEWSLLPLLCESGTVLALEIPTGWLADRLGRKVSVISGYLLGGATWILVPMAANCSGRSQLVAVCICFAVGGLAETLVSGALEAWAVDNLHQARNDHLIDVYFARSRSFASLGSMSAACLALLILYSMPASRPLLGLLWQIMGTGMLLTAAILGTIGEARPSSLPQKEVHLSHAALFLRRNLPLLFFFCVMVIASFAASIADEAFDIALVSRGMDARALAALGIIDNLVWMVAPMCGFFFARHFGVRCTLILFLALPAASVSLFFFSPGLFPVIGLYLLLDMFDGIWDPVAEAHLHHLIPSSCRATLASAVNQGGGLAELAGIGLFSLMLGTHSEELRDAVPGLADAFSGGTITLPDMPWGIIGLPVPDQAIVFFVLCGLAAIPFVLLSTPKGEQMAGKAPKCKRRRHP